MELFDFKKKRKKKKEEEKPKNSPGIKAAVGDRRSGPTLRHRRKIQVVHLNRVRWGYGYHETLIGSLTLGVQRRH